MGNDTDPGAKPEALESVFEHALTHFMQERLDEYFERSDVRVDEAIAEIECRVCSMLSCGLPMQDTQDCPLHDPESCRECLERCLQGMIADAVRIGKKHFSEQIEVASGLWIDTVTAIVQRITRRPMAEQDLQRLRMVIGDAAKDGHYTSAAG